MENQEPLEQRYDEQPRWQLDEILDNTVGACMDVETDLENLRDARNDLKIKKVVSVLADLKITADHLKETIGEAEDKIKKTLLVVDDFIEEN